MPVFNGSVYSKSLRMHTGIAVSVPDSYHMPQDGRMPVLYLLHGLCDDHTAWTVKSNAARYAEQAGIALVMPEVQRSFYTDMKYGPRYFTYVADELPALMAQWFRIESDPQRTYIAGLSMGGYGALKIALRRPQRYAAVGCFSGCVDLRSMIQQPSSEMSPEEMFGINGGTMEPEDDIFLLTAGAAKEHTPLPSIYLTCGLSDPLHEQNARLRKQLDFLKLPYVYEEWAGSHEWNFWDRSIRQFLQFIAGM